jgi:hypothetical protein
LVATFKKSTPFETSIDPPEPKTRKWKKQIGKFRGKKLNGPFLTQSDKAWTIDNYSFRFTKTDNFFIVMEPFLYSAQTFILVRKYQDSLIRNAARAAAAFHARSNTIFVFVLFLTSSKTLVQASLLAIDFLSLFLSLSLSLSLPVWVCVCLPLLSHSLVPKEDRG